jgi:hypothetical protein
MGLPLCFLIVGQSNKKPSEQEADSGKFLGGLNKSATTT